MMVEASSKVCAVIPAFREAGRIGPVVEAARPHVDTVLVIDDGSDDDTAAQARTAGAEVIVQETNQGKGAALRVGFEWAVQRGFDSVVCLDGDGQHDPSEIPNLVDKAHTTGAAIVVGTRMLNAENMPWVRRKTNQFMSWLLSRRTKLKLTDSQCGFRLIRTDVIQSLQITTSRFEIESELLVEAGRGGHRVEEVPIRCIYGTEKSKISPISDTIRFFRFLFRRRK
jgi:glycosyltransferase involved in cell wall biosynthesis